MEGWRKKNVWKASAGKSPRICPGRDRERLAVRPLRGRGEVAVDVVGHPSGVEKSLYTEIILILSVREDYFIFSGGNDSFKDIWKKEQRRNSWKTEKWNSVGDAPKKNLESTKKKQYWTQKLTENSFLEEIHFKNILEIVKEILWDFLKKCQKTMRQNILIKFGGQKKSTSMQ